MLDYRYYATVERVIDGDTVDVVCDCGFKITTHQRLRLADVDTPETHRPSCEAEREHGKKATRFVKDLIEGQQVIIETKKTGKYGRYIATIYLMDGTTSVNQLLVENDLIKRDSYE